MNKIVIGEIALLENGKEYICISKIVEKEIEYAFLMSNFKPVDIKIAEEIVEGDRLKFKFVNDPELKENLIARFKENTEKQLNI